MTDAAPGKKENQTKAQAGEEESSDNKVASPSKPVTESPEDKKAKECKTDNEIDSITKSPAFTSPFKSDKPEIKTKSITTQNNPNLNPSPKNGSTTGNDMSISELLKHLTIQNQKNKEEVQQSVKEEKIPIKKDINDMKAGVDNEFVKIRKDFGDFKEDTVKMVDEKNQEIKDIFTLQTQNFQAQINPLKENRKNDAVTDREVQLIGLDNSSLPQPVLAPRQVPKQYITPELQEYLNHSLEDETVINNVEWLIKQFSTNRQVMKMDILKPILNIINPRETTKAIFL